MPAQGAIPLSLNVWFLVAAPVAWLLFWAFGGGAMLWVGARRLAKVPKATYLRSLGANCLGGLGAMLVHCIITCMLRPLGPWPGPMLGLLAGTAVVWWVIAWAFHCPLKKAVLAWVPKLPQTIISVGTLFFWVRWMMDNFARMLEAHGR
jgi:hypothetical protein